MEEVMRYKIDMELARSRYDEVMELFEGYARRHVLFDMWNNGEIDDRALLWVIEDGRLSNEIISEIFADEEE
jgi:hypothetical protein